MHSIVDAGTWQWFPGTHWGKGQGQYNAVDEATCRLQAQAMVEKGLVKAVRTFSLTLGHSHAPASIPPRPLPLQG